MMTLSSCVIQWIQIQNLVDKRDYAILLHLNAVINQPVLERESCSHRKTSPHLTSYQCMPLPLSKPNICVFRLLQLISEYRLTDMLPAAETFSNVYSSLVVAQAFNACNSCLHEADKDCSIMDSSDCSNGSIIMIISLVSTEKHNI